MTLHSNRRSHMGNTRPEKEGSQVGRFYGERHPDGPFATPITVAATYCSPDAYDDLIIRARAPEPGDEEIAAFKAELQQALTDPSRLPGAELSHAVDYDDGSDEAFLRRLWHDLYGEQPDTAASHDGAPDTDYYEDLAGRLYGLLIASTLGWTARPRGSCTTSSRWENTAWRWRRSPARSPTPKVPITDQERSDMLALTATMNLDDPVSRALGFCPRAGSAAPA